MLLLAGGASALLPPETLRAPHPAILIEGDAGFHLPGSGVRSGSGTPEDPFVISDWEIVAAGLWGVALLGTRAHVVIENVGVTALTLAPRDIEACIYSSAGCETWGALRLENAENVTFRRVAVGGTFAYVSVADAQRVRFEELRVENLVRIDRSSHVEIVRSRIAASIFTLLVNDTSHLRVADSLLVGEPDLSAVAHVNSVDNVTFERNVFRGNSVWHLFRQYPVRFTDVQFVENHFDGSSLEIQGYGRDRVERILLCGNRFRDADTLDLARVWANVSGLQVVDNRFEDSPGAVFLEKADRVEGNLFRNLTYRYYPLAISGRWQPPEVMRGNAFEENTGVVSLPDGTDARENWWGDASGPSGIGPGAGQALRVAPPGGTVAFDPWLVERPVFPDRCASG